VIELSKQMMLPSVGLSLPDMVAKSIETLRLFAPKDGSPYWGAFSGGKDSVVIKALAAEAGVPATWNYNMTTIDPPELLTFMKRYHPDVNWVRPKHGGFFARMRVRGFPTRRQRWCCEEFKESRGPRGCVMLFGIRGAESPRRAKTWSLATIHTRTRAYVISPILYWSDDHVWQYIRDRELPYCSLYDEGFTRLGCIGCPMAREKGRRKEFDRWPAYEKAWKRAFKAVWDKRAGTTQKNGRPWFGTARFKTWEEMWEWWVSNDSLPGQEDECQGALDFWS